MPEPVFPLHLLIHAQKTEAIDLTWTSSELALARLKLQRISWSGTRWAADHTEARAVSAEAMSSLFPLILNSLQWRPILGPDFSEYIAGRMGLQLVQKYIFFLRGGFLTVRQFSGFNGTA
jgi:hypothetical protein